MDDAITSLATDVRRSLNWMFNKYAVALHGERCPESGETFVVVRITVPKHHESRRAAEE